MHVRTTLALAAAALLLVPASLALAPAAAAAPVAGPLAERIAENPTAAVDAFVTFPAPVTSAHVAAIEAAGARVLRVYGELGVVYVAGEGRDVLDLARVPGALLVSGNEKLTFHMDAATVATNARQVWDSRSTSTTPVKTGGVVADGRGVGVAVVDSGIDGTHPDLAPAMGANKKWLCTTPDVDLGTSSGPKCAGNRVHHALLRSPGGLQFGGTCTDEAWENVANGDTTSGHGTHVAGIVAGRGTASGGRHMGAAPGATLYGLGAGDGDRIQFALEAFQWVSCNHATVTPPIRIVTNSWGVSSLSGAGLPFDPNDPISLATNELVAKGLVVVFSAGNGGGDGSQNVIGPHAKNPTPGVVSVANYDDQGTGTRGGSLAPSSSRGQVDETPGEDWPDVAAPGTAITSTRSKSGVVVDAAGHPLSGTGRFLCCDPSGNQHVADYVGISGTSMSAPHVAGIVALLLQAKPTLTPAAVEHILEDSATPIVSAGAYLPDPTNAGGTTNHAAGHGLVDALAALHDGRVGASGAGSPQPRLSSQTRVFVGDLLDPQANAQASWVVPAGPVGFAKLGFVSGGTTVANGDVIRFVVDGGAPISGIVVNGRADADATVAPGPHRIEMQLLMGGVWRAFDAIEIRAV